MHDSRSAGFSWPRTCCLAAMMVLLLAVPSGAADDEDESLAVFAAARTAVGRDRLEKSRVLGFHDQRKTFTDLPAQGAILVGFDLGVGKFFDIETVYALRPIYLIAGGEIQTGDRGLFRDRWLSTNRVQKSKVLRTVRVRARPGYAIGALTLRSGLNINGLSVTFMRINGRALDPRRAYTSAWVGDRTGGGEASVNGNGALVVGVFGSADEEHIRSLGLIFARLPASARAQVLPPQPANPPRTEKAAPPMAPAVQPPAPRIKPPAPAPAPKAVEPIAEAPAQPVARPADPPPAPEGTNGLPILVFGAVTASVFLVLIVSLTRKEQVAVHKFPEIKTLDNLPVAVALPPQPPSSTGICDRLNPRSPQPRSADAGQRAHPPGERGNGKKSVRREEEAEGGRLDLETEEGGKPTWRAYSHTACGSTTVVTDEHYILLECPFRLVDSTYCCGCRDFVPLDQVRWADSDERISDYRRRVAASVPFWRKVYLFLFGSAYEGAVNWGVEWKGKLEGKA